jgi:hypothetical protein
VQAPAAAVRSPRIKRPCVRRLRGHEEQPDELAVAYPAAGITDGEVYLLGREFGHGELALALALTPHLTPGPIDDPWELVRFTRLQPAPKSIAPGSLTSWVS